MVKKISHKEVRRRMKMDEMAEAQHWMVELWQNRGRQFTWGAVIVAILAVGVYLYRDAQTKNRQHAANVFGSALDQASGEQADEALSLAEEVADKYSSTSMAPFALLLKGNLLASKGNYEEALPIYDRVAAKGIPQLASAALISKAVGQENLKRDDEAEATYRRVLSNYAQSGYETEARFRLASLLERQGKSEEAFELYKGIPEDTAWGAEAKMRVKWIETPVVAMGEVSSATSS